METLRDILKDTFEVDLPIAGGYGNSPEDAIIIECEKSGDGIELEYKIVNYLMLLLDKSGNLERQELVHEEDKHYDKIIMSLEDDPETFYEFYFDITKFYGKC
jgi:hypothetical protein